MPDYNLYFGAVTGTEADRCLQRVQATPQNTPIPFVWLITISITGTAGGYGGGSVEWAPGYGIPYQKAPDFDKCEVLDVQFGNPAIVENVTISQGSGTHEISYSVAFKDSGTTNMYIYVIENACDPSNP